MSRRARRRELAREMKRADFYAEPAGDWTDVDEFDDEPVPTWPDEDDDRDALAAG